MSLQSAHVNVGMPLHVVCASAALRGNFALEVPQIEVCPTWFVPLAAITKTLPSHPNPRASGWFSMVMYCLIYYFLQEVTHINVSWKVSSAAKM